MPPFCFGAEFCERQEGRLADKSRPPRTSALQPLACDWVSLFCGTKHSNDGKELRRQTVIVTLGASATKDNCEWNWTLRNPKCPSHGAPNPNMIAYWPGKLV